MEVRAGVNFFFSVTLAEVPPSPEIRRDDPFSLLFVPGPRECEVRTINLKRASSYSSFPISYIFSEARQKRRSSDLPKKTYISLREEKKSLAT